MTTSPKPTARPPIVVSETDAERLSGLALRNEAANPKVSELLLEELARARVLPDARMAEDVVGMNSRVAFRDEAHGREREVTLVYPQDADIAAGRISIMTPVGAGLIGLRSGQSILWPDRDGEKRVLRVLSVARAAMAT